MLKRALLILAVVSIAACNELALDKPITHSLAFHYFWPWNQLIQAATALDAEDYTHDLKINSDSEKYQVSLNVKKFKPEELKIRVKGRNIIVEGAHNETNKDGVPYVANYFIQQFILPPGSKQEEVTAVLNENRVLTITLPRHELPPPPPEREVPIEVLEPKNKDEDKTIKPELEQQKN